MRVLPLLAALALALPAAPTLAAAGKAKAAALGDPTQLPVWKAQKLVNTAKLSAFFDPNHLSQSPILSARSAALIDYDTGKVLWEKNGDTRCYPASTTKILTGLLLAENTQPGEVITCMDPKIRQIEESSLHIQPWEKFTSKDLLYGTMLRSANDGAVVIAQHVSGSVAAFADLMNQRAREAGATNTHFTNPNGLPDKEHWTTAKDMALIARAAMQNERFEDAVSERRRTIARSKVAQDVVVASRAKRFYESYPGADGIKTGYTRAAKHCFVGSASRDGRRLIAVVMGATDNASGESMPILSWGFRRFPSVVVAKAGTSVTPVPVHNGAQIAVPAIVGADLRAVTDVIKQKKGEGVVETEARPNPDIQAPVRQGQEIGTLVAKVDGQEQSSVPLLAAADVALAPSLPERVRTGFGKLPLFLGTGAGLALLVGLGYGTASAKGARRRRNRFAAQGGRDHRSGSGSGRR